MRGVIARVQSEMATLFAAWQMPQRESGRRSMILIKLKMVLGVNLEDVRYARPRQFRQLIPLCARVQHSWNHRQPSRRLDCHRPLLRYASGRSLRQPPQWCGKCLRGCLPCVTKRSHLLVTSALATAIISLLATSIIISALAPEAPSIEHRNLYDSSQGHLFRLSPVPPGADWTS